MPHKPQLDGLRFLAFLAVFFFHARPASTPGAAQGVQVFFTLSGFLITRILILGESGDLGADLKRFYIRRTLRIFPLYYAVVAWLWARRPAAGRRLVSGLPLQRPGLPDPGLGRAGRPLLDPLRRGAVLPPLSAGPAADPPAVPARDARGAARRRRRRSRPTPMPGCDALGRLPAALLRRAPALGMPGGLVELRTRPGRWEGPIAPACSASPLILLTRSRPGLGRPPRRPSGRSWAPSRASGSARPWSSSGSGGPRAPGSSGRWPARPVAYLGRISYGLYVYHLLVDRAGLAVVRPGVLPDPASPTASSRLTIAVAAASWTFFEAADQSPEGPADAPPTGSSTVGPGRRPARG